MTTLTKEKIQELSELCKEYSHYCIGITIHNVPRDLVPENFVVKAEMTEDEQMFKAAKDYNTDENTSPFGVCLFID